MAKKKAAVEEGAVVAWKERVVPETDGRPCRGVRKRSGIIAHAHQKILLHQADRRRGIARGHYAIFPMRPTAS